MTSWTYQERRDFHNRADRHIWAAWSNRASFSVTDTSDFARRFARRAIPINLDIRWVTAKPHWTVTVWKLPPGQFRRSSVIWDARTIQLDTNDFQTSVHVVRAPATTVRQVPVAPRVRTCRQQYCGTQSGRRISTDQPACGRSCQHHAQRQSTTLAAFSHDLLTS